MGMSADVDRACGSLSNQKPDISDELQAARSGRSAAAVNQTRFRDALEVVVADLIFTLHLMITVIAYAHCLLPFAGKYNCRKRFRYCQASRNFSGINNQAENERKLAERHQVMVG
tara:strand:+ start:64 stop:408 length:345 start_codon:yes stop_codon:yes gene_type:complete